MRLTLNKWGGPGETFDVWLNPSVAEELAGILGDVYKVEVPHAEEQERVTVDVDLVIDGATVDSHTLIGYTNDDRYKGARKAGRIFKK